MRPMRDRRLQTIRRILTICLFLLVLTIIGGTAHDLFMKNNKQNEQIVIPKKSEEGQTFLNIGRLRISTADPQPEMVIIFVSFVYYPDDKAFSEELVLRVNDFRQIIINYFSSFSSAELHKINTDGLEDTLKEELLQRFNAILRLGQIETLYFGDFMVLG